MTQITSHPLAEINTADQLAAVVGEPTAAAHAKERTSLHQLDREWLAASAFCLVATAADDGTCDVSPKGDPPGFTLVLDDTTIAIPERAGNRRVDGFSNILRNPHVGLIYLIPGRGDTLRINGRARLVSDAPWFDRMLVRGTRPVLATVVEIDQVFHHCAKAFLRSQLWDPATWTPDAVPDRPHIAHRLERRDQTLEQVQEHYGPSYLAGLYPDG